MRIGILTLPLHTNYGGILQAYALQTVLERMGHEVVVFNKKPRHKVLPVYKRPIYYSARLMKKLLVDPHTTIRREYVVRKEYPIVSQYTRRFVNDYIHCEWIKGLDDVEAGKLDAIVVGSDQIWRPRYFGKMWSGDLRNAFLAFTKGWNIKRFAYAASFGVDEWEYPIELSKELKTAAEMFDGISVREDSGVALCKEHLGCEAAQVLDPTMLLKKEDYVKLIDNVHQPKSSGNLFCYILDSNPEKDGLVARIAREKNLTPFHVKAEGLGHTRTIEERTHKPVEAWLRGFYDAEFVVTDSFHACVFSILFGKPFIVVGNKGRGLSRFSSLMDMFGLKNNLLGEVTDYDSCADYSVPAETYARLDKLRELSNSFIHKIK